MTEVIIRAVDRLEITLDKMRRYILKHVPKGTMPVRSLTEVQVGVQAMVPKEDDNLKGQVMKQPESLGSTQI